MKKNLGRNDRAIRFILGLIVAYLGYIYTPWLYIIAAILLITSFTGFCLLYKPLKLSTVEKTVKKKK